MKIGIIAEDESDFLTIKTLIGRIAKKTSISTEKRIGKGCGKYISKCSKWANELSIQKCSILIMVHDLDTNDITELYENLNKALSPYYIKKYLISIPVQELEAWLLADPEGIKKALKLKKTIKVRSNPEYIVDPKEFLWDAVLKASESRKGYIDTTHNKMISEKISLDLIRSKCNSFVPFYEFVLNNIK